MWPWWHTGSHVCMHLWLWWTYFQVHQRPRHLDSFTCFIIGVWASPPNHVMFYILPSRFVCLPHLFKYTRPRIPIGYEPRAVPLIICVILCLSAPVRSFGRDHSVSFCVFCVFLRLFEIIDREQFISPYPPSPKHHPAGFPLSFSPYLHHIKLIT